MIAAKTAFKFDDLFSPVGGEHGFYFHGLKKRYRLTDFAYDKIVRKGCLIYPGSPQNYYFQVINGFLFLKYQYIIGSCKVCRITDIPK